MSKIFIVTNGTYSDYSIQAVFSDREKAEKYLAELKLINDDNADIEEWDVDTTDELVAREWEFVVVTEQIMEKLKKKVKNQYLEDDTYSDDDGSE